MTLTRLALIAALFAWAVVALGAYVRLSDAGLGCPDWPGCYGRLGAPSTAGQRWEASKAFPDRPVEAVKAWKEMIHRYAAGTLGLLVFAIFILEWREKKTLGLSAALLALVAFQALLGRWTVTELLRPAIVTAHLLGGMSTFGLLVWMAYIPRPDAGGDAALGRWAALALVVVAGQIFLGGWTSSHYAALACGHGLACHGEWLPPMDFASGFSLGNGTISPEALTAIHWSHRLGALVVAAVVTFLAAKLLSTDGLRGFGRFVLALLLAQVGLGVANVALGLPLASAVLHNAVAAALLGVLVMLNRKLRNPT